MIKRSIGFPNAPFFIHLVINNVMNSLTIITGRLLLEFTLKRIFHSL